MEFSNHENGHIKFREQEDFPGTPRKVRWSMELEEVHYFVSFTPRNTESRWKNKMKHFKLESLLKKINGRSDKVSFEEIRDINKPWDELFEQYQKNRGNTETRKDQVLISPVPGENCYITEMNGVTTYERNIETTVQRVHTATQRDERLDYML